jgi:hypothetical protein
LIPRGGTREDDELQWVGPAEGFSRNRLALGQLAAEEESGNMTAIMALLELPRPCCERRAAGICRSFFSG